MHLVTARGSREETRRKERKKKENRVISEGGSFIAAVRSRAFTGSLPLCLRPVGTGLLVECGRLNRSTRAVGSLELDRRRRLHLLCFRLLLLLFVVTCPPLGAAGAPESVPAAGASSGRAQVVQELGITQALLRTDRARFWLDSGPAVQS